MDIDIRAQQLQNWLNSNINHTPKISQISGDASFRRYFRVKLYEDFKGHSSLVLMDAPPLKEDCNQFVKIAKLMRDSGVNTPEIVFEDINNGFLALSDFGDITYENYLIDFPQKADELYEMAFLELIKIQQIKPSADFPEYNLERMLFELNLFPQWFLKTHLQQMTDVKELSKINNLFTLLINRYLKNQKVLVHRDYHIRNLMVICNNQNVNLAKTPAVIDFQDAVIGPISYDAVSILRDAYRKIDDEIVLDYLIRYWEKAKHTGLPVQADFSEFYQDFEYMVLLRHIKVLGIFCRLNYRDGKSRYLEYLPLVFAYCQQVANRYRELNYLAKLFNDIEDKVLPQANMSKVSKVGYTF